MNENEQTLLTTLDRGITVLEFIAINGPASAKRISRELGIRLGTCYHILRTLGSSSHVQRLADGQYDLGSRSYTLGRQIQQRTAIAPELAVILTRLHSVTRETSYISRWRDGAVTLQHYLTGLQATNVAKLEIGFGGEMHARASSKAILAHLPAEQLEALFRGVTLKAVTPHTILDVEELLVEFAQVRRQGYAIDREEFAEGVHCVASAFFDKAGVPVGAYTVSVPTERFMRTKPALITAVKEAADIATRLLAAGRLSIDAVETDANPHRRNSHPVGADLAADPTR